MNSNVQLLCDALQYIPSRDRDTWVRIGMAIKSEMGDAGRGIWEDWSRQDESYNDRDAAAVWKSLRGNGVTAGTLFHEAKAHGWCGERMKQYTPAILRPSVDLEGEREQAAIKARELWKAASEAKPDHPYLQRKGVSPTHTLREISADATAAILGYAPKASGEALAGRLLLAPIRQLVAPEGMISSAELIDEAGRKSAIAGGAKAGGFWAAQRLPEGDGTGRKFLIGEGVATALSAQQGSGYVAIAALSAGNLAAVAQAMRIRFPFAEIVVLADLTKTTGEPDPRAVEAAKAGKLAIPEFGANRKECEKDFNDLARLCGPQAVKRCVEGARALGQTQSVTVVDPWPDPIPVVDDLPAVKPFDFALLPETLRPWIFDIAERVQCPPDFPAVAAIISLSAVLGRKIGIRPKRWDDWLEVPNLWGAIVGRSGIMKTPAMRESMRPLQRLEALAARAFEDGAQKRKRDLDLSKLRLEAARSNALKALKKGLSVDAAALTGQGLEEEPQPRRYVVNDTTVEALGEILRHNPNGVLAYRDEVIGLLKSLDREGQEGARGFYLSAWSGIDGYTFDRIGRGLNMRIDACCLSLLGSIQPSVIGGYLREAVAEGGADGLLARFQLLVWPEIGGEWRNVDRFPDSAASDAASQVFERLDALDPAQIGATGEPDAIPYLRFDDQAQDLFTEWRNDFEPRLRSGNEHPALEAHMSKYRKLVPALALLNHLAEGTGTKAVGETDLLKALAWVEYLETHAQRAYASVTHSQADGARALLGRIRSKEVPNPFTARDVYLKHWTHLATPEATHKAVRMLCDMDYLRAIESRPGIAGGRPKFEYAVNPKTMA